MTNWTQTRELNHLLLFRISVQFTSGSDTLGLTPSTPWWSYIYGAAHQGSSTQSFLDDVEQMWTGLPQLVDFSDTSSEILEALCGGSSRQSLITTIQPAKTLGR